MRRRRRRSSFAKPSVFESRYLYGAAAVALVALFVFFVHKGANTPPEQTETRIELPDAFKQ